MTRSPRKRFGTGAARSAAMGAVVAAIVVTLAACSGSDKSEPPPRALDTNAPAGSTVVSDPKAGFAVTLPSGWRRLPADTGAFDAAANDLRGLSDKVGPGLTQLKSAVRGGAVVAAIDPATGSTVNLISLPTSGDSPEKTASKAKGLLRQNGATDFTTEKVTVGGEPAVRQSFRQEYPGGVALKETQVYVVRRGHDFILTLTGDSPDVDRIASSLQLA